MSNYNGKVTYFGTFPTIQQALNAKIQLWRDLFNMDIRTDVLKATMEKFDIDKEIQMYVLEGLNEVV